jgi:hypothetical protein
MVTTTVPPIAAIRVVINHLHSERRQAFLANHHPLPHSHISSAIQETLDWLEEVEREAGMEERFAELGW